MYWMNCSAWAAADEDAVVVAAEASADAVLEEAEGDVEEDVDVLNCWRMRFCKGLAAESFWCAVRVVRALTGSSRRRRR